MPVSYLSNNKNVSKMAKFVQTIKLIVFFITVTLSSATYASFDPTLDPSIENIDGRLQKLSSYIGHGKWVILNIWGTRCPPCREEIPELNNFHDQRKNNDAIVVGIAIDFPSYGYANKKEVIAFVDDYLVDFPILLSDSEITEKIGLGRLSGLPTTYVFNPDGEIIGMQVGGITEKILNTFIDNNKTTTP
ncbi:MAG: thioredoxin [Thiotrichaceae bacterium]|nr:MAG: thioredoxin [Thiotrichaceae bacterium]